jgi:hypothetical protein
VQAPNIGGCEPVIGSVGSLCFSLRGIEQSRFDILDVAHARDTKEIA